MAYYLRTATSALEVYARDLRPAAVPSFEIGSVVADTYAIEGELGRGGMGIVFLASHRRLPGKKVAIKVLQAQLASDELLARFKREAHIVSVLAHPNIVHVEDFNVTADGTPYLVLEYLRGESLAERLTRGPLDTQQALSIARQIGSALAAAHARNIVHRDLKPHNVFLTPTEIDGRDTLVVKVLDFGISKMLDSDTVKTDNASLLGTPQYMAPEQATGQSEAIGVRTDVFSLGTIVYEMLSGRAAFAGASLPEVVFKAVYEQPRALPTEVPEPIAAAVRQAMAKAPAERFASVTAFIEALTGKRVSSPVAPEASISSASAKIARAAVDELASTVDSANVPQGMFPTTEVSAAALSQPQLPTTTATTTAATPARRRTVLFGAIALAAVALAVVVTLLVVHRAPARRRLDNERLRSVAAQLMTGDDVLLDGKHYRTGLTGNGLRIVKFEIAEHPYEAIEQNPNTHSRWAQLAREGHRVVQFRDLETSRYIGVVVDGSPRRPSEGEPE